MARHFWTIVSPDKGLYRSNMKSYIVDTIKILNKRSMVQKSVPETNHQKIFFNIMLCIITRGYITEV